MPHLFRPLTMPLCWVLTTALLTSCVGCRNKHPVEAEITGGSMYPTLLGQRWSLTCDECRFPFEIDAQRVPQSGLAVCPNCGFRSIDIRTGEELAAQPVRICKIVGDVKRWQLVCFQSRTDKRLIVKRVVGLPSEVIEIRNGLIHANGQPVHLPPQVLTVGLPVFDSQYQPQASKSLTDRFTPLRETTRWNRIGNRYTYCRPDTAPPPRPSETEWDWLAYRHWRCFAHHGARDDLFPIEDNYGFNQAVSRDMNTITRYRITASIQTESEGICRIRCGAPHTTLVEIDRSQNRIRVTDEAAQSTVGEFSTPLSTPLSLKTADSDIQFLFSSLGGQRKIQVNGKEITLPLPPEKLNALPRSRIFEIGANGSTVTLARLQIDRGIHYYSGSKSQFLLKENEYLVLGDNPPLSRDSRQFENAGISRSSILGTTTSVGTR